MTVLSSRRMIAQKVKEKLLHLCSHLTPKAQAFAIIQPGDNISVMFWLNDNFAIVIFNYMAG